MGHPVKIELTEKEPPAYPGGPITLHVRARIDWVELWKMWARWIERR